MKSKLTLVTVSGLLTIVVYLSLTLVAYAHYPTSISPADNWLSDLGNRLLNPGGAVYYRIATVLTSVLLGVFFVALHGAFPRESGRARLFMTAAEVCGLIASLGPGREWPVL